jgi:hypothetical protein
VTHRAGSRFSFLLARAPTQVSLRHLIRQLQWLLSKHTEIYVDRINLSTLLRRVFATIVAVENQWVLHNLSKCICSLSYPKCIAHALYCHLQPAPLYNIFPHHFINGMTFEKKLLNTKCVSNFCTTFVWNNFHSKKNRVRQDQKCRLVFT